MSSVGGVPLTNGTRHWNQTVGYYLDELTIPLMALLDSGFNVTFANPMGNAPPMDPHSDRAFYFDPLSPPHAAQLYKQAHDTVAAQPGLQTPHRFADMTNDVLDKMDFDAVFIPGGHPPMVDLWQDAELGRILVNFFDQRKTITAICHGPTALLSAGLARQPWIFEGRNMTVFSKAGELINEARWGGRLDFYPEDKLRAAGANVIEDTVYMPHVVRDLDTSDATVQSLVTGQNPFSAGDVASFQLDELLRECGVQEDGEL